MRLPPSKLLDSIWYEQETVIKELEQENERLQKENLRLLNENISFAQEMSARTLQLALSGAFDNVSHKDKKVMGYETESKP